MEVLTEVFMNAQVPAILRCVDWYTYLPDLQGHLGFIKAKVATPHRNVGNYLYQLTQHCVPKYINPREKISNRECCWLLC
jgi:uncharacterized protein YcaQ